MRLISAVILLCFLSLITGIVSAGVFLSGENEVDLIGKTCPDAACLDSINILVPENFTHGDEIAYLEAENKVVYDICHQEGFRLEENRGANETSRISLPASYLGLSRKNDTLEDVRIGYREYCFESPEIVKTIDSVEINGTRYSIGPKGCRSSCWKGIVNLTGSIE